TRYSMYCLKKQGRVSGVFMQIKRIYNCSGVFSAQFN
ncbi:membrane protein insertion efficiency factor YidD, partial [Salmonella enterica subsp. enterica serovar Enteritidis]|nr:membrane protein insertion efficiency factor YidD [Salmonella enterica subsp. enterica serovar Enteritidis]